MELLKCILTENDCYRTGRTIAPKGVMVHSTGANNPTLRRYVQPVASTPDRDSLLAALGINPNGNHWNQSGLDACVHAFVGKLANGSVAAVQTLPWNWRGWHAGTGTGGGSANNTHISFEICEDGLDNPVYFDQIYQAAVELTTHLCQQYSLNPLADGVIICHSEGYRRGTASGHADVEHWFPRFGKTMDHFRADVAETMEEDNMTQEKFDGMMEEYLARRAALEPSDWSAKERAWIEAQGLMQGSGDGGKQYKSFCTREELAIILHRFNQLSDG